ncbi:MAG: formylglycine-generating enzyme family protein [Pirellulales bacterium]|nr:formylglycine-generating enzyme family protein [Pirellulales bacterium]
MNGRSVPVNGPPLKLRFQRQEAEVGFGMMPFTLNSSVTPAQINLIAQWNGNTIAAITENRPAQPMSTPQTTGKHKPESFENAVGMKMILIPASTFTMGAPAEESRRAMLGQTPQHEVTISKPFFIGATEVTVKQWASVMDTRPWERNSILVNGREVSPDRDDFPVTSVSYDEALEFCKRLSTRDGRHYRLPYEAEWELACRAGTTTAYSFGPLNADHSEYAWAGQSPFSQTERGPHPVAQKKPNPWGLFDMHGNMMEWCMDWSTSYEKGSKHTDPKGGLSGRGRVCRSGDAESDPLSCRSAAVLTRDPAETDLFHGFRVVATMDPAAAPGSAGRLKLTAQELAQSLHSDGVEKFRDRELLVTAKITSFGSYRGNIQGEFAELPIMFASVKVGEDDRVQFGFRMSGGKPWQRLAGDGTAQIECRIRDLPAEGVVVLEPCKLVSQGSGLMEFKNKQSRAAANDPDLAEKLYLIRGKVTAIKVDQYDRFMVQTDTNTSVVVSRAYDFDDDYADQVGESVELIGTLSFESGQFLCQYPAQIDHLSSSANGQP